MQGRILSISGRDKIRTAKVCLAVMFLWVFSPLTTLAQEVDPELVIPPALNATEAPLPDLTGIVTDLPAALALGKALFWDMQVGSDNLACASCHFHAGADNRAKNQISPGLLQVHNPTRAGEPDTSFGNSAGRTATNKVAGPNHALTPFDFPLRRFADMEDRNSPLAYDTNDVVSSQGSFGGFMLTTDPDPARFPDFCGGNDTTFTVNSVPVRKVEPRNSPTTINAVFNHRNFWDGRANNIFNGVDPFGPTNPQARILVFDGTNATLATLALENASLASQAVGPPLSAFEMACSGRSFKDLGRGMLPLFALAKQQIDATDSVLGADSGLRNTNGTGLNKSYAELIQTAFDPAYWNAGETRYIIVTDPQDPGKEPELEENDVLGYTQMEHNFAMFFGIAVMLYEATLVSDQAPYDAFILANEQFQNATIFGEDENDVLPIANATGVNFVAGFGQRELLGLDVFVNKGRCIACHNGPEFTSATVRQRGANPVENMASDGGDAFYDGGFYNVGVRPSFEDLGIGGDGFGGLPLSIARQQQQNGTLPVGVFNDPADARLAVDGAFKTPTLRNVELTGPYMHNGGLSTLKQVVEFYDRGSDSQDVARGECPQPTFLRSDESGFGNATANGAQCSNLHPEVVPLNLTEQEIDALVAFMIALTDPRVKNEMAPFDHPDLPIPNGHVGDQLNVATVPVDATNPDPSFSTVRAKDSYIILPAVGAGGRPAKNLPPLETFLRLDPFSLGLPNTIIHMVIPLLLED